jgi:hypothetical protein
MMLSTIMLLAVTAATPCDTINAWLATNHLAETLQLVDLTVEDGTWTGTLVLLPSTRGQLADQWCSVTSRNHHVPEELLLQLAMRLDASPDDIRLRITSVGDPTSHLLLALTHHENLRGGDGSISVRATAAFPRTAVPQWRRFDMMYTAVRGLLPQTTLGAITTYLRRRYARGRVIIRDRTTGLLILSVDHLRNEILPDEDRWERLTIAIARITEGTQLLVSIDASYAPGIGDAPPAAASYRDLEVDHSAELAAYTEALATTLQALGMTK